MAMHQIHVARARWIIRLVEAFREIGAPVEREMRRCGLPTLLEETPDAYGSLAMGLALGRRLWRLEGVDDAGWLAFCGMRCDDLRPDFLVRSDACLTVNDLVVRMAADVPLETNEAHWTMEPEPGGVRIAMAHPQTACIEDLRILEMGQLMAAIALVQRGPGPAWRPPKIGLMAPLRICDDAREYFYGTGVHFGQDRAWISVPTEILAMPTKGTHLPREGAVRAVVDAEDDTAVLLPAGALREALAPYLGERRLTAALAAEIAGTSPRTLQRFLRQHGLTLSELVDQCRYRRAVKLLSDADAKLIDVCMAVGYEDPSHFARAFKRIAGVSPREYRQAHAASGQRAER